MRNKRFVELVGASSQSISDALDNALKDTRGVKPSYQILEARSETIKGQRRYQVRLKIPLKTGIANDARATN